MTKRWLAWAVGLHAAAAIPWWFAMWISPAVRGWFIPKGTPDTALFSFALADATLFAGAGIAAAWGLTHGRWWAPGLLLVHAGAGCYAALYTLLQWILTGDAWQAALAMVPSLVLLPYACWFTHRVNV